MADKQQIVSLPLSEDELGAVFENAPISMFIIDEDLKVQNINRAALELTDKEMGEVRGMHANYALPCLHSLEESRGCGYSTECYKCPVRLLVMETLLKGKGQERVEVHFPIADDDQRKESRYIMSTTPVTISGHKMALVCIEDFTELKMVEQELAENEKLFNSFMNNNPAVAYMKDEQGRYVYLNQTFEDRFDIKLSDWRGKTDMEVWPGPLAQKFRENDLAVLRADQAQRMIEETIEDGKTYYWLTDKFPFRDASGRRLVGGVSVDITELKETQEQLREDETKFRAIADYTYNWENWVDPEGRLLWVNPAVERVTGYTPGECMAMSDFPMSLIYEEDLERTTLKYQESLKRSSEGNYEFRIRRKDGQVVWVSVSWQPIYDDKGVCLGQRSSLCDITARKEAELRLQETLQTSEDIVRSIPSGLFIYQYQEPGRLTLIEANPEAERLTGVKLEEWRNREFNEIWPQARSQKLTDDFLNVVKSGKMFETEELNYRDDRIEGAFKIRAFRMPGQRLGVAFESITRRKQAELALLQSEEKYRTIYENAMIGLFRSRISDGKILECNDLFAVKLGFKDRSSLLKEGPSINSYFDEKMCRGMMKELAEKGIIRNYETSLKSRNGERMWFNLSGSLKSNMGYIEWVSANITREKHARDELQESQRALSTLISNLPGMAYRCKNDEDWTMEFVSEGCQALTGYLPEEIEGNKHISYAQLIYPEDRELVWDSVQKGLKDKKPFTMTYRITTASGDQKWVWEQGRGVFSSEGELLALEGFINDITERKRSMEQIEDMARFPAENPYPVLRVSREGIITHANEASSAVLETWQCSKGEPIPDFYRQLVAEAFDSRKVSDFELKCSNNHIYSLTLAPIVGLGYTNIYGLDITERQRNRDELQESQRALSTLIGNLPGIAYRCKNDKHWTMEFVSEGCGELTGYLPDELTNNKRISFVEVIHRDDREHVWNRIQQALVAKKPFELTYRITTADAKTKWVWDLGCGVFSPAGEVLALEGFMTDITDRKRVEEQLRYNAFHDNLTSLPNRTLFKDRLEHAANRARRSKDGLFGVLFLDLDRFKIINDSLGHGAGDELLKNVTERLELCLRPGDTIARMGGDEFCILLEDIKDITDATHLADRIQNILFSPFHLKGQEVFISASIGITISSRDQVYVEHLLRDADTAMYRAKSLGRARYEIFDKDMHLQSVRRLQMETDMRRALNRQEFKVYYQPIISLETGRIAAFEALLRWHHSRHGLLLPKDFLPIAEETGLIVAIGQMVLQTACEQLKHWQGEFPQDPPLKISLNLSRRQLNQPELVKGIQHMLETNSLNPQDVMFEITEDTVMGDSDFIVEAISSLKKLDVQLLIDDFGTGHSSLSLLHDLPINSLKIDHSFISNMGTSGAGLEMVYAIINLARNLNMTVIAEGEETIEQLVKLRQLKCDYGQGFYFSKALDADSAGKLLRKHPHW